MSWSRRPVKCEFTVNSEFFFALSPCKFKAGYVFHGIPSFGATLKLWGYFENQNEIYIFAYNWLSNETI